MLYSCKEIFNRIKAQVATEIDGFPLDDPATVCIAVAGMDEPSIRYVRNKLRDFKELGIMAEVRQFAQLKDIQCFLISQEVMPTYDGIIVQRPILLDDATPKEAEKVVADCMPPKVDIDGVVRGSGFMPPSVRGLDLLFREWGYDPAGKTAVVIGRGDVGRPVAEYLIGRDATVTICHSKTKVVDRLSFCVRADIVVGAAGLYTSIRTLTRDYDGVIIDYGITKGANTGLLHGDFDPDCAEVCKYQTSVPGGMGLMVRAGLLLNIVDAYKSRRGLV